MRDWTAERTFPLRPFNIDMNPLVIAGAGGKRVDAWLIYLDPIGKSEFMPDSFAQTRKCEVTHVLPSLIRHCARTANQMSSYRSRSFGSAIYPIAVGANFGVVRLRVRCRVHFERNGEYGPALSW